VACYRRALEVRTREEIPQLWANTTWRMVIALQGAEHWVEALERARALQAFGCEWNKWDEMEASLGTRVAQLKPEVALPSNSRTVSDPLPGVDDDGLAA